MVTKIYINVTILILVDGFLQFLKGRKNDLYYRVTILILVDGFLQYYNWWKKVKAHVGHNPYFSRWFSAIQCL